MRYESGSKIIDHADHAKTAKKIVTEKTLSKNT